jgi:hypothetical protein
MDDFSDELRNWQIYLLLSGSTVNGQWSMVNGQRSTVNGQEQFLLTIDY